jgi:hypothetical protein
MPSIVKHHKSPDRVDKKKPVYAFNNNIDVLRALEKIYEDDLERIREEIMRRIDKERERHDLKWRKINAT